MTLYPKTAWSNLYMGTKSPKLFSILVDSEITTLGFADKVINPVQRPEYYNISTDIPISGSVSLGLIANQNYCGSGAGENCGWNLNNTCENFIPVSFTSPLVSETQTVIGLYPVPYDPANTPMSAVPNFYVYIKDGANILTPAVVQSGGTTYYTGTLTTNKLVKNGTPFFIQNEDPAEYNLTGALSVNYSIDISSKSFQLYKGDLNLIGWIRDVNNSIHMNDIVKSYLQNSVYISSILTEFYNQLYFQGFYSNGATPFLYFSQTNPMSDPIGTINNFNTQYISTLNITPHMNSQNFIINSMMIIPEISINNNQCSIKMFVPAIFESGDDWEQTCENLMNSILQDSNAKYSYQNLPNDFSLKLSMIGQPVPESVDMISGKTYPNFIPKDDYAFIDTPFQQVYATNGPWWPGPNCVGTKPQIAPFILGYTVTLNVVKWTPMLLLYVSTRYPLYNYSSQLCSDISNDIVTYPTPCLKYENNLNNICQFDIELPPVYSNNLDILDNIISTNSNSCSCFQSLLAPSGQNNTPNGIAVNKCFSSKCSQNIRDNSQPPLTDSQCKKNCELVWDWLNSEAPFGSVKPDDIDWNRLEQICGKSFRPYNVPFFDKDVLILGLIIVVFVVILVVSILKNRG